MILTCLCGRRFRTPDESVSKSRTCPQCGGMLTPEEDALCPALDLNVLVEQMKLLRDELVLRDRALRRAQAESSVLKSELARLRARSPRKGPPAELPLELPSNRVPLFTSRDP